MSSLSIRQILDRVLSGEIRIPVFQRGFVWDEDRIAHLMDSIYKGYPFGSVILWQTNEQLNSEKKLGPFELPDPKADYPISYVLDGQQRVTAIFGTFQTQLSSGGVNSWPTVYFDMLGENDSQESRFHVFGDDEAVDQTRFFPINTFFDTVAYRKATRLISDELASLVDDVQATFKEATIPILDFKTNERSQVAIVFERVNRLGVKLDTLQLLSAWTWSEDFDLQSKFGEISNMLAPFGFDELGTESNMLLRCCAAIIKGSVTPNDLISLNGNEVRERFPQLLNGLRGAVDYLGGQLHVAKYENLPFPSILIPLCVYFARENENKQVRMDAAQSDTIKRWFWRSNFDRRYSADVNRKLNSDIREMEKLRNGQPSNLGNFEVGFQPDFYRKQFHKTAVATKTFVLQLAQMSPRSFISGNMVSVEDVLEKYNRAEFHHLMPQAFMRSLGFEKEIINSLANFAIISKVDNNELGGVAPSRYREKMDDDCVGEILGAALCPLSLFNDDPERFLEERESYLYENAKELMGTSD